MDSGLPHHQELSFPEISTAPKDNQELLTSLHLGCQCLSLVEAELTHCLPGAPREHLLSLLSWLCAPLLFTVVQPMSSQRWPTCRICSGMSSCQHGKTRILDTCSASGKPGWLAPWAYAWEAQFLPSMNHDFLDMNRMFSILSAFPINFY